MTFKSERYAGLLSGGAPNGQLIAGAMHEFLQKDFVFDTISTAGAGTMVGLATVVPADGDPLKTLYSTVNCAVSDEINSWFPINYKVFHGVGPFTEPYVRWCQQLPRFSPGEDGRFQNDWQRLANDWLDFWLAMGTPTTLGLQSLGMCASLESLADSLDLNKLKDLETEIFLNSYDLDKKELCLFRNEEITIERLTGSYAMSYFYPPYRVDNTLFTEGATHDPLGLWALVENREKHGRFHNVDYVIVFDLLTHLFERPPRNLWDAFNLVIMQPLATITEMSLALYSMAEPLKQLPPLYRMPFHIPPDRIDKVMDWSYSNAVALWDIGKKSADEFIYNWEKGDREQYRYHSVMQDQFPALAKIFDVFRKVTHKMGPPPDLPPKPPMPDPPFKKPDPPFKKKEGTETS